MYALLDYDNQTVIEVIPPDVTFDEAIKKASGRKLITMTVENSPAYMYGRYIDGKFYPPKEGN